jgi:hypothetical protein
MLSNCPGTNFSSIVRNDGGLLKGWALAQNLLMNAPAAAAIGAGDCLEIILRSNIRIQKNPLSRALL